MGPCLYSLPAQAGFTSDKPEKDEELNEELWEDQSFEEYYSTHESEEASQPSDEEDEVNKPDIYVTRSGNDLSHIETWYMLVDKRLFLL